MTDNVPGTPVSYLPLTGQTADPAAFVRGLHIVHVYVSVADKGRQDPSSFEEKTHTTTNSHTRIA